jgi:hypothetical protein
MQYLVNRTLLALGLICFAQTALGRDYYLSQTGSDAAAGTREAPWKTIERAGKANLEPGDRLLLQAGQTFVGKLDITSEDSGQAGRPVVVSSHGDGRARIDGGNGPALIISGAHHVRIQALNLVGSGRKTGNSASGICILRSSDIQIDDVDVSGFQKSGVLMDEVERIRVTRVHAFENGFAGISSDGGLSEDIYVGHCLAENNPGDPTNLRNHSGNGIVIGKVRKALIEHCEARYNGWDMPRKGNGPVGIWTWDSDSVVIQFCVSHHNRSTGADGGGFDFDGGTVNGLIQYNYSHDNHGSGYLICQYRGAKPFRNNVVRYNISQDDGLTNHNAGIYVWVGGSDMESTDVYNNTVFNSKGAAVAFGVDPQFATQLPKTTFRNNIFVSGEAQIEGGASKGRFEGNLYWAMGDGGFLVDGFENFEEWAAATGQETVNGEVVGKYADPMLRKDGTGLLTDPGRLSSLTEYTLKPGSPAIDAGLRLKLLFSLDPGSRDFFGASLPQGTGYDMGAVESF